MRRRWLRARCGFALLVVLWIVVGIGMLSLAGTLLARRATATVRNRTSWAVARWQAEGCAAWMRALIASAMVGTPDQMQRAWQSLDRIVDSSFTMREVECRMTLRAAGTRLDVNTASGDQIRAILLYAGVSRRQADTLTDAVLDWRDVDDDPRPLGAERAWYVAHRRLPPRNGPLASVAELRRVRGLAALPGLDTLFSVEPGRIALGSAALPTLATLPGVGAEAVARIAELRAQGIGIASVLELDPLLSPFARARLHEDYPELARVVVPAPEAWLLTTSARAGAPAMSAHVELRLERAQGRVVIVRERVW